MGTRSLSSAKAVIQAIATVQNTLDYSPNPVAAGGVNFNRSQNFANGVGSQQASRGWEFQTTIASGAVLIIDLHDFEGHDTGSGLDAGAGRDIVGQTMFIEEVAVIVISNENIIDSAGLLEIEPAAVNGWTALGSHTVANGGALGGQGVLAKMQPGSDGLVVAEASNNRIQLTANGAAVKVKITMLGRHDVEASSSSSLSSTSSSSSSSPSSSSLSSLSSSSSPSSSSSSTSSLSSSSSSPSSSSEISSQSTSSSSSQSVSSQSSSSSSSSQSTSSSSSSSSSISTSSVSSSSSSSSSPSSQSTSSSSISSASTSSSSSSQSTSSSSSSPSSESSSSVYP